MSLNHQKNNNALSDIGGEACLNEFKRKNQQIFKLALFVIFQVQGKVCLFFDNL